MPSENPQLRAFAYVDGLNLYRRILQGHPGFKWLDLHALLSGIFPEYEISRIRYFTAMIKPLPGSDISSPQRQQTYIRALKTLPNTSVHLGKFRIDPRLMPVHPTEIEPDGSAKQVKVKKTEEKGSDVALASWLLIDAIESPSTDLFIVVSNDSDLVIPMKLASEHLGRNIALLSPMQVKRASNELKQTKPLIHRQVTFADLLSSQFPRELADETGQFRCPDKWNENSESPGP